LISERPTPECPLFPKAAVQIGKNREKLGSAFGQKRTSNEWMAGTKNPARGRVFGFLVAGARYVNYMQIEIEPFPLVA